MDANTGLSSDLPSFVFNPACIGKNAPDRKAMLNQIILFMGFFYNNTIDAI
jgi:hypothetical protein